jgi:hypothetical protein
VQRLVRAGANVLTSVAGHNWSRTLLAHAISAGAAARDAVFAISNAQSNNSQLFDDSLADCATRGDVDGVATLLAAGADAARVRGSVSRGTVPLLMTTGWCPHESTPSERLAKYRAALPAARKQIERAGFVVIRSRVLEICNALQELQVPAPQLIEILVASCEPFAYRLPYHILWNAVVLVKHFHQRQTKN